MIFGIGVDICSYAEIRLSVAEFGVVSFAEQYCTNKEIEFILSHQNPIHSLAEHLSLKEAVGKAFGTGLVEEFWFDDIEVKFGGSFAPLIFISADATEYLERRIMNTGFGVHISQSKSTDFASASCIVVER